MGVVALCQVVWCVVVVVVSVVPQAQTILGIPPFLEYGNCANVTLKSDFDPIKYSGLWFDIQSVPNKYQYTKMCITQTYTWTGTQMEVATRGLTEEKRKVRQGAIMHVETDTFDDPHPAYMTVVASGVPRVPYQIVATDYRTYACVYSCLEYFGFRAEFAWVFGRTPVLPPSTIDRCHLAFANMGVDPSKMVPIVQGQTCPYYTTLQATLAESEQHLLEVLGPPSHSPPHKERALGQDLQSLRDGEVAPEVGVSITPSASQSASGEKTQSAGSSSGSSSRPLFFVCLSLLLRQMTNLLY